MQRLIRALAYCALVSLLAACAAPPHVRHRRAAPPPPPPPAPVVRPNPAHEAELARRAQADERIDTLGRRIDERVDQGYYPPATGSSLHHRLDVIRQEINDMAAQHGGGLSSDEQRVIYQELDSAARVIGN